MFFAANLKRSSHKRHREYETCDVSAKKLCRQSEITQRHTPKTTADISSSTSPELSTEHPSRFSARSSGNQLCGEPLCDLNPSTKCKSHESLCSSVLPNSYTNVEPAIGVRQAFIKLTSNRGLALIEVKPDSDDAWLKEFLGQNRDNCLKADNLFSSKNPQKDMGNSQQLGLSSCIPGPLQHFTSVLSAKRSSKSNIVEEKHFNPSITASKPNCVSISCPASKRRTAAARRCSVPPDDINDLFTPDPLTYKVKSANPKMNGSIKSTPTEARPSMTSSKPVTTSNNKVTGTTNLRTERPDTRSLPKASAVLPLNFSPMVVLKRIPVETTISQPNTETFQSTEKRMLNPNLSTCSSESDTIPKVSPVYCPETPQENQACEGSKQQRSEDPLDVELDIDLRFALDLDVSQSSSSSSEEETLFSLHEMMNPITQPVDAPEKQPLPEPTTHGCQSKFKTVSSSGSLCFFF